MKLLFLDFDGVIFSVAGTIHARILCGKERMPKWELDPVALSLIANLLIDHQDMNVVISSTWRIGTPLEELKEILGPKIGPRVIGKTPVLRQERGQEIKLFLETFKEPVADIIILDDDRDMNPYMGNLFWTDSYNGFTARNMIEIEQYLKMTPRQKKIRRFKKCLEYNLSRWYWHTWFLVYWRFRNLVRRFYAAESN